MRLAPFAAAALVAGALAAATLSTPAAAAEQTYSSAALKSAQAAGKPIIVDVTATWCSVCAAQKPIVQSLIKDPKYKDVLLLKVDFDSQKQALRKLNVQQQSTIVVFKGSKEVARSTGDTSKAAIQALFDKAS